jgi:hypothetical protein
VAENANREPVSGPPDTPTPGNTSFDRRQERVLDDVTKHIGAFLEWDNGINILLKDLLAVVVDEAKRSPGSVFSEKSNIDSLINAIKSSKGGGGISGGDVVGGGVSLSDIADFITKIGEHAEHEKDMFLKLIFMVVCNCDCVCNCLCK